MTKTQQLNSLLGHEVSLHFANDKKALGPVKAVLTDVEGLDLELFQAKINGDAVLTFHSRVCRSVDVMTHNVVLGV